MLFVLRIFLVAVVCSFAATTFGAEELSIPLTVHEALRQGVTGIDRTAEPVTVGIPFPRGVLGEKSGVPQLALDGVKEYQFRTLARWPDGSVRWALADFQADVKAGGSQGRVRVVRGEGNSSGRLAEDRGEVIAVNTGGMSVEIRKKGFNLFDRVVVGEKTLVAKGASKGIVVMGGEEREFLASNDAKATVSIEENGPLRAVVKADGVHVGQAGRMMGYTVRMHFYKGKSRVKVFYSLRNASREQVENPFIRSLDLSVKIAAAGPLEGVVSAHDGLFRGRLSDAGDRLAFYQAVSDFPQEYAGNSFYYHAPIPVDYSREKKRGFVQEGYWITKNGQEARRGQRAEYPDLAFLDLADAQGSGVTVGVRFAAGWWPKGLRASADGGVEVALWPRENEVGYWIRYGSHSTFEVLYDFHNDRNDHAAAMKRFQYPLIAKAPLDWYNRCAEGIYPLYPSLTFADEADFARERGWEYKMGWRKAQMTVWRYHYWGWGGFLNQHDFARVGMMNFLRRSDDATKSGEYFLYAENRFNYNADWSIPRSDDYDSSQDQFKARENKDKVELAKVVYEIEHMHWYGLPLYYYMTGDERIRDAVLDWGEVLKGWARQNWTLIYDRFFGWEMYSLAAMYDFTGDKAYMNLADGLFERLLSASYNERNPWSNIYIDWNRGFIMRGDNKLKPGLMMGYIIHDGLYNYYLHMDDGNPLKERVADVLEGLWDFMYREPYFEGTKGKQKHWAFWVPYVYRLDDRSKSQHSYRLVTEAFYANLAPYLMHGEPRWLERMDKLVRSSAWDEAGIWGGFGYMDHPGLQAILYERRHPRRDTLPPPPVSDLAAEVKGKEVVLKWTAPADAQRYQVKHAGKKLVESLGFDPDGRTYQYDPAEYANWWAGENVPNEPAPASPGTAQSHAVKGLKPGRHYFAIRSWDAASNRSLISNIAEVEVP